MKALAFDHYGTSITELLDFKAIKKAMSSEIKSFELCALDREELRDFSGGEKHSEET